jgi:hypothetical protein
MKNKVLYITLILSLIIIVISWLSFNTLYIWFNDFLIRILKPMASWTLSQTVFSLTIGLIPISSFLSWNIRGNKTSSLIAYNVISICMLILLCILVFIITDLLSKPKSPLLPEYIIFLPFQNFWNYFLPILSLLTPLAISIFNSSRKNK